MTPTLLDRPEVVDDLTRRELVVGGAGLGLLVAACGRRDRTPAAPPAGDAAPATRRVRDSVGEVEVPARPQRVVTMWRFIRPHVLSLGAPLVATGQPPSIPLAEDTPVWLDRPAPAGVAVFDQGTPNSRRWPGCVPT